MNREVESLKQRLDHDQARRNDIGDKIANTMKELPVLLKHANPEVNPSPESFKRTFQITRMMATLAVDQQTYMTLSNRINETQLEILAMTMRDALKVMVRP